jgi:ATP-binding cassette subfamily C exporter for protease/lipase
MNRQSAKQTELRRALSGIRGHIVLAFGISFVMTLLALAPLGYMRDVYGPVINSRSTNTLIWVTVVLIGALALAGILEWIRSRVLSAASIKFGAGLSQRVFNVTFQANLEKLPGAREPLSDLRIIRQFLASPTLGCLLDTPLGLVFLMMVFLIHPTMGYLSLTGALITLAIGVYTEARVRPLITQAIRNNQQAQHFIADSSRNATVIQAMGMGPAVRRRWLGVQNLMLEQQAQGSMAQAVGSSSAKTTMLAQGSVLLGVGALLTLIGHLPPEAGAYLIIAKLLGAMAVRPLLQLIQSWKSVINARESYRRLDAVLTDIPEPPPKLKIPPPTGHLVVSDVMARPPGSKATVLREVSFNVKPGRVLAIVGPSGSGKSSLARLLVGVWRPIAGSVRLDGAEIADWNKDELGPYLGYLPQDVELFAGTLAENIARFGVIDPEALRDAVQLAGLQPLVESLPDGLQTEIHEGGQVLSGGQRQRVGIARAIYGSPKLIVMDEPNSSLDARGESDLAQAILALRGRGAAVVVITHRKTLLKVVDLMLVLKSGKPKIFGPRNKVLQELSDQVRAAKEAQAAKPAQPQALQGPQGDVVVPLPVSASGSAS